MEPLQPADPSRIATYELTARLGAGGMGQVYLGRSAGGRMVAVKVIRPELTSDPEFRARFRREVVAMKAVSGFFTAPVVDADPDGDPAWLATAYISGPPLADAVRERGPMPQRDVLVLAAGLAEALGAIHREGLTHRDLKPANVLLADDGPRVIDFGLAVTAQSSVVTQAGVVVGTPSFMSPEQINGHGVGPASDVYSLGSVLTYAATGRSPHGEGGTMELMYRVVNNEPDLGGMSGTLLQLVQACLSKDPALRPTPARILQVLSDGAGVQATAAVGWVPPQMSLHPPQGSAIQQNSGPQATLPMNGHGPSPFTIHPQGHGNGHGQGGGQGGVSPFGHSGAPASRKLSPALAIGGGVAAVVLIAGVAIAASSGGDKPTPGPTAVPRTGGLTTGAPATGAAVSGSVVPATSAGTTSASTTATSTPTGSKNITVDIEKLFTASDATTYLKAAKSDIFDHPQDPSVSSSSTMTAHGWSVSGGTATNATYLNSVFVQSLTARDMSYGTGSAAASRFYDSNTKPLPSDPPYNPFQLVGVDKASIQVKQPASSSLKQERLQYGQLEMLVGNLEISVKFSEMRVTPETCRADLQGIATLIASRLPK